MKLELAWLSLCLPHTQTRMAARHRPPRAQQVAHCHEQVSLHPAHKQYVGAAEEGTVGGAAGDSSTCIEMDVLPHEAPVVELGGGGCKETAVAPGTGCAVWDGSGSGGTGGSNGQREGCGLGRATRSAGGPSGFSDLRPGVCGWKDTRGGCGMRGGGVEGGRGGRRRPGDCGIGVPRTSSLRMGPGSSRGAPPLLPFPAPRRHFPCILPLTECHRRRLCQRQQCTLWFALPRRPPAAPAPPHCPRRPLRDRLPPAPPTTVGALPIPPAPPPLLHLVCPPFSGRRPFPHPHGRPDSPPVRRPASIPPPIFPAP